VADTVGAVAVATGVVALLDSFTTATGLGVVYLLAVLFVAIRRGEIAALATAVLSVLALNYFFIEPRHRLTLSRDPDPQSRSGVQQRSVARVRRLLRDGRRS